jgi:hypothetical protein
MTQHVRSACDPATGRGETPSRPAIPANYIEAVEVLTVAVGMLEGIAPPPDAAAYKGTPHVNDTLKTLRDGLIVWPNTVGPACRNTPSVIVNWDPALHADLAGLQQSAALPAGPGRDKQIVNFIGQILAILHYSKSAIEATAAGLQSLAQVIGTNGTPVLSILQQVQLDAVGLQVKVSELQIQLKIAEAPYPVGNPSTAAAVQLELNTARPAAAAASAWALILCHAHDQFSLAAPAVLYLAGIWFALQTALNGAIAIAQQIQQNPSTITPSEIALVDKAWEWLQGEMQGIAGALSSPS